MSQRGRDHSRQCVNRLITMSVVEDVGCFVVDCLQLVTTTGYLRHLTGFYRLGNEEAFLLVLVETSEHLVGAESQQPNNHVMFNALDVD